MADKIDKKVINSDYIDKVYDDVKDLFQNGSLEKDIFYKCLISLAFEYLCISDMSNCVHLIAECDTHYINVVMSEQMDEDPKFKSLVIKLVDVLDRSGLPLEDIETEEEGLWLRINKTNGKA